MVDLSKMDKWSLGKCFDHSVLPKDTTEADIRRGCQEAKLITARLSIQHHLIGHLW